MFPACLNCSWIFGTDDFAKWLQTRPATAPDELCDTVPAELCDLWDHAWQSDACDRQFGKFKASVSWLLPPGAREHQQSNKKWGYILTV